MSEVSFFCLSPGGQTFLTHKRGINISHTEGGGHNHFHIKGAGKHFYIKFTFNVGNTLVSEAIKLFTGARIFRGTKGTEILVKYTYMKSSF